MTQRKYTTARHSLSVLHFLTAGYVSLRPRAVGIDGAGQQRRQVCVSSRKIQQVHSLSLDTEVIVLPTVSLKGVQQIHSARFPSHLTG